MSAIILKITENNMGKLKENKKVKYPIALKLISIITILIILSLGTVTALVTLIIRADVQLTAEQSNHTINAQTATSAESELSSVRANAFLLMNTLSIMGSNSVLTGQYADLFFERNQNIAAVIISDSTEFINNRFFVSNETDTSVLYTFLNTQQETIERSSNGETIAVNATSVFGIPTLALMYPWQESEEPESLIVVFSAESLTETFTSSSTNSSFMINDTNDLLIHSDFDLMKSAANMSNLDLITQMRQNNDENRQIVFTDSEGIEYFGAYTKLDTADIGILTMIESALVFEAVNASVYRNILLGAAVLCLAILFIWFFSKSISKPVKALVAASEQIEQGEFLLNIKARSKDELGLLTARFVDMGKGLAERERLKDTFGRFTNKAIAEQAMKGELKLGGETKTVTVFFSDIRSFTAISEKLLPDEVVEFLNDYMTRMVACVNDTNGVVDKFIGDAVMAVWGTPISAGSPEKDALNCVKASLLMRSALLEFNIGRGGDKKPIIKIGCGVNTGPVVAGQIGSNDRMEYTVIGDAVNLASRTETLTKPFGADILITEDTYELIKEHVIVERMPAVTVKGKEKPVAIYAVINMPKLTGVPHAGEDGPKTIEEVRTLVNLPTPDFAKVDGDAEEKKYKIGE